MTRHLILTAAALTTLFASTPLAHAQEEGPTPTQILVSVESKSGTVPTPADITAEVNGRPTPITSFTPIPASGVQIALLLDDGLRQSFGIQLPDLKKWITTLRPGTEVFVGYMQNGRVIPVQNFTTDYAAAAGRLRIPFGISGANGSPYFSVSDFVKNWPRTAEPQAPGQQPSSAVPGQAHARFILMLTNGVDPYNGSVSVLNQDSPYVQNAANDAQRAGVPVYSIYYSDRAIRGGPASFSGQSYLSQVADATGGRTYLQGLSNPVSLTPFLNDFSQAVAQTYIATLDAVAHKKDTLLRLKLSSHEKGVKLHAPSEIHPGERESALSTQL